MEKKIKIEIPTDTAQELLCLIRHNDETGNSEWDNHMKLVKKQLEKQLVK